MEPNFYQKTYRFLITAIVFLSVLYKGYGQTKDKLDIQYSVDSVKIGNNYNYTVKVNISNADSPFTFYLCDKEPWLGGKILEQSPAINTSYCTFSVQYTPNNLLVMAKGSGNDQYNWKTISTKRK